MQSRWCLVRCMKNQKLFNHLFNWLKEDFHEYSLEAAVYAKPVVFGPVYEKYQEAID